MMNSLPIILCIETSNEICSVAIARGQELISIRESNEKNSHAQNINLFIAEVLDESALVSKDVSVVAVSAGPGSYTGLRIGVSSAKGFCFANEVPLIAVNTLEAMLCSMKKNIFRAALIHARQTEFYCSAINSKEKIIYNNELVLSGQNVFPKDEPIFITSTNLKITCDNFLLPNISFIDGFFLSAKHLIHPAYEKLVKKDFEDLAYFEPNYIKPVHISKNCV